MISLLKAFHRTCEFIWKLGFYDFLLLLVVTLFLGGDANNENIIYGHYYLTELGQLTEVSPFVFYFAQYLMRAVFIIGFSAVAAGFAYFITGGGIIRPASRWDRRPRPIDNVFWLVFDSWRKPSIEFFVHESLERCVEQLYTACEKKATSSQRLLDTGVIGSFRGKQIALRWWQADIFTRTVFQTTAIGRLRATPRGTFIQVWHRFAAFDTIAFIALGGLALSGFFVALLKSIVDLLAPSLILELINIFLYLLIFPTAFITAFFFVIWIGSELGKEKQNRIIKFIYGIFPPGRPISRIEP